jgi:hypothetical protein
MSEKLQVHPQAYTLGELELLEREGITLEDLASGSARALVGMVWLELRRRNPEATIDEARALPLDAVEVVEDPPSAVASSRRSRR